MKNKFEDATTSSKSPSRQKLMCRKLAGSPPNRLIRSTNVRKIIARISRAESLDLTTATSDDIKRCVSDCLLGYSCPRISLARLSGTDALYRAVSSRNRQIRKLDDLWYPPPAYVLNFGRANRPGQPMFYAATDRDTALVEMRSNLGDRFVVSTWICAGSASPNVREMGLLETLDRLEHQSAGILRENLQPTLQQNFSDQDLEKQRHIRDFLGRQFTKDIPIGSEYQYQISAAIADHLLIGDNDGLVYGSVATEQLGINVALDPSAFRRLYKCNGCQEVAIVRKIDQFKRVCKVVRVAKGIRPGGSIMWD